MSTRNWLFIMLRAVIRLCRGSRSPGRGSWPRLAGDERKKWAEFRRMYRCEPRKREARAFQEAGADSMCKGVEKPVAGHE